MKSRLKRLRLKRLENDRFDACRVAWNKLIAGTERIRSIAIRDYAETVRS